MKALRWIFLALGFSLAAAAPARADGIPEVVGTPRLTVGAPYNVIAGAWWVFTPVGYSLYSTEEKGTTWLGTGHGDYFVDEMNLQAAIDAAGGAAQLNAGQARLVNLFFAGRYTFTGGVQSSGDAHIDLLNAALAAHEELQQGANGTISLVAH